MNIEEFKKRVYFLKNEKLEDFIKNIDIKGDIFIFTLLENKEVDVLKYTDKTVYLLNVDNPLVDDLKEGIEKGTLNEETYTFDYEYINTPEMLNSCLLYTSPSPRD